MKSIKIFIFAGVILGILLSIIVCVEFMDLPSKTDDIYYSKAEFDYVIPQPGNAQLESMESYEFIDKVIPYYIYSVLWKGRYINIYFIDYLNFSNTPFGDNYIIEGVNRIDNQSVIIDEETKKITGLKLGNYLDVDLEGVSISFKVAGISERNEFSNNPSVAILYAGLQEDVILESFPQLSYSGAFVSVNERTEAESFFAYKYIPEGKIGELSWYDSEDTYEYVRKSISSSPAMYEITDVGGLKTNEISATLTKRGVIGRRVLITGVILTLIYTISILFVYFFSKFIISDDIRKGLALKRLLNMVYFSELLALLFPLICGFTMLFRVEIEYAYKFSIIILLSYVMIVYIEHFLIKRNNAFSRNNSSIKDTDRKGDETRQRINDSSELKNIEKNK